MVAHKLYMWGSNFGTPPQNDIDELKKMADEAKIDIAALAGVDKKLLWEITQVRVIYEKKLALMEQEHRMKISALKERMSIMGMIQAITAVAVIIHYFIR